MVLNLGPVVAGTIDPMVLKAESAPNAATKSTAKVAEGLDLLGGLVEVGAVDSRDSTGSGPTAAEATRVLSVDTLALLDLGRLLQGLGLDVMNLPLSMVSGLVTSLGLPVNLRGAASLESLVTSLTGAIEALQTAPTATITAELLVVLGGLRLPAPLQPALSSGTDVALLTAQSTLTTLISTVATTLESATLFELDALNVTTLAKATDTVASSVATAGGTIGSLRVRMGARRLGSAARS